jgi:hypothetical protein
MLVTYRSAGTRQVGRWVGHPSRDIPRPGSISRIGIGILLVVNPGQLLDLYIDIEDADSFFGVGQDL